MLTRKLPALMFTGFQESSHWRKETERYRALAQVARQVCIFAGKPLPDDQPADVLQIELQGDDPLRQEWFVTILSSEFSVVLCGLDNLREIESEAHRQFDTIWSFDPVLVNQVLDVLENVLADYRPDVLPQLVQARADHPPVQPDRELITTFTRELLRFEDQLQSALLRKSHALEVSEALYRSVVMNAPVVLFMLDSSGRIMLLSGARLDMLFEDNIPAPGQLIFEHVAHIPKLSDYIRFALTGDEISTVLQLPDSRVYEFRSAPVLRNDPNTSVVCVLTDVTERVQAEEARMESERLRLELSKQRELSELRKQLMLTLSHELRTPLAAIRSASDLLTRYYSNLSADKREERLKSIQEQIRQLSRILEDIEMVIRSDNETFTVYPTPTVMKELCEQVVTEIEQAFQRQVTCQLQLQMGQVHVDTRWMRYIFTNLLSNAAKYSPAGTPIEVEIEAQGENLIICVRDYGIGIPQDDLQHIFEPFYRGSNVGVVGGTGLGLVITHNIVRAHQGTIEVETHENVGTTFRVTLPVIQGDDADDDATHPGSPATATR